MKVEKRFKGGASVLASYTASKLIADTDTLTGWLESGRGGTLWGAQNINDLRNERSLVAFDVSQRLVVSYVLDLPFGQGKKFAGGAQGVAGKLLSGWGVNGISTFQTGYPIQPGTSQNLCNCFGGGSAPTTMAGAPS